jgi:hypothetical protein
MALVKQQVKPLSLSPSRGKNDGDKITNENFVKTVTADISLDAEDVILADGSSNTVTVTLPTPEFSGQNFVIKAIDISNAVDVDTEASETIDGASSYTFTTQYDSIKVVSDGSDWFIVAEMLNA